MAKNKHKQADLESIGLTYVNVYAHSVHTQQQPKHMETHLHPLCESVFLSDINSAHLNAFVFATGIFNHTYTLNKMLAHKCHMHTHMQSLRVFALSMFGMFHAIDGIKDKR